MNEIYKERVLTTCTASVYTLQVLSFCLFKRLFSSAAVDRITQEREIQGPYDIWIWNDGKKITIIFFNNYAINYIRTHQMATHQMATDQMAPHQMGTDQMDSVQFRTDKSWRLSGEAGLIGQDWLKSSPRVWRSEKDRRWIW